MNRNTLIKQAEDMGFHFFRSAKHADLYRHRFTSKIVGVPPHTPSDNRSFDNTLADMRRAAGATTDSPIDEIKRILGTGQGEVMMPRRTKDIVQESTLPESVIRSAVPRIAREPDYVKLGRGWYVYDPYLDSLSDKAKRWACEEIIRKGPKVVYRSASLRESTLREAVAMANKAEEMAARERVKDIEAKIEPIPLSGGTVLPPIYEAVADDGEGTAVLRDEDGRLWVAHLLGRRYRSANSE